MIILTSEQHGCAYSIDSEGTLFYTSMMEGGGIETEDWCEVDFMSMFGEEEYLRFEVDDIHDKLIAMMKSIGEYYQC